MRKLLTADGDNLIFSPARYISPSHQSDIIQAGGYLFDRKKIIDLASGDLWPCRYGKPEKVISTQKQIISLQKILLSPKFFEQGGIFAIGSEVYNRNLNLIINAFIYARIQFMPKNIMQPRWWPLYGLPDELRSGRPSLNFLVIDNIHPSMSEYKLTLLFDILFIYRHTPIILNIIGLDPLQYCRDVLKRKIEGALHCRAKSSRLDDPSTRRRRVVI